MNTHLESLARTTGLKYGTLRNRYYENGDRGERLTRPLYEDRRRPPPRHRGPRAALPLTPRQLDVLRLLCRGLPNKVVAFELGIAQRVVEMHRSEIMARTGCSKEIQLGMWAQRNPTVWQVPSAQVSP